MQMPRLRSRGRRRLASLLVLQADLASRRVARSSAALTRSRRLLRTPMLGPQTASFKAEDGIALRLTEAQSHMRRYQADRRTA